MANPVWGVKTANESLFFWLPRPFQTISPPNLGSPVHSLLLRLLCSSELRLQPDVRGELRDMLSNQTKSTPMFDFVFFYATVSIKHERDATRCGWVEF